MAENCKLCEWSVATDDEGPCVSMKLTEDAEQCPDFAPLYVGQSDRCAVCGGALEEVLITGYADTVWSVRSEDFAHIGNVAACASCGTLKVLSC